MYKETGSIPVSNTYILTSYFLLFIKSESKYS